jgi:endonuclease/exonuclease/phosphatase family metal-dependent hydrolase
MRFLSAALLLLAAAPLGAQAPIRALSFNIRYGTANDGDHAWPNRRGHVVTVIRDHAPHLIGFQEALRFQLDELEQRLHRYQELGVGRDDGKTAGEYSALWVDTLRLGVVASGTFWFSDTPDVPGSKHWGNGITRISTWARLVDRATGDTIRVYNNHWDHQSQPSRERSAALLLERIATDGSPRDGIIVLGDFNADETNPASRAMISAARAPLRDSYRVVHPNATVVGTFNSFRGDSTQGKIDFVLADPRWIVVGAGIDRRRFGALWPSDHFPVWAILQRTRPE